MLRLIRTIASLTVALGSLATTAHAGETGAAGQPETPASTPATPPPQPPAAAQPHATPPSVAPPTGSAPAATQVSPPVVAPPVAAPAIVAPPAGTATAPSKGTPALVLDTEDYEGLLGKSVRAQNGDDLGRIIDVIIDRDGRPRAAIIDFGGFLGVGSRKIAVDWRVLKFVTEGKVGRITLALNRNQVRVSPEYKTGEPIVVLGASGVSAPQAEGDPPAAASPQDKAAVADKPGTPDKAVEKPEKAPDR